MVLVERENMRENDRELCVKPQHLRKGAGKDRVAEQRQVSVAHQGEVFRFGMWPDPGSFCVVLRPGVFLFGMVASFPVCGNSPSPHRIVPRV